MKLGQSKNIKKRLHAYSTGRDKHPDIKFIFYTEDHKKLESCVKQIREKSELYKMDVDTLKYLVFSCAELDMKLYDNLNINDNYKKYDAYVIFDDFEAIEYLNTKGNVIGYEKIN